MGARRRDGTRCRRHLTIDTSRNHILLRQILEKELESQHIHFVHTHAPEKTPSFSVPQFSLFLANAVVASFCRTSLQAQKVAASARKSSSSACEGRCFYPLRKQSPETQKARPRPSQTPTRKGCILFNPLRRLARKAAATTKVTPNG